MTLLDAREGYRLWAPSYSEETAICSLEQDLVADVTPPLAGLRLLDAGCGTGQRLRDSGAASAVGVDLSPEMLEAGLGRGVPDPTIKMLVGDIRHLPLPDQAFDVVWCRLVLGYLPQIHLAYAEMKRVADAGAIIIVTDFHPAAIAAGHRRTFRHGTNVHELENYVHEAAAHQEAALDAGLELIDVREAQIGPAVEGMFVKADRHDLYRQNVGLPVIMGMVFRRGG